MLSRRIVWSLSFIGFSIYAFIAVAIGPSLPMISKDFKLSPEVMGALASLFSVGGLTAILGGWFSDKIGRGFVVSFSFMLIGFGSLLLGSSQALILIKIALILTGIGAGFFEASVNALISDLYSERRGAAVNILHVAWNIGSGLGPPLTALIILLTGSWRYTYLILAPPLIVLALIMFMVSKKIRSIESLKAMDAREFLKTYLRYSPIAVTSIFIVSVELGLSAWLPTMMIHAGGELAIGGLTLGIFWGAIGAGRLLWSPIIERVGYRKSIILSSLLGAASMALASTLNPINYKILLWAVSGLLLGPLFPTLIAWITDLDPEAGGGLSGMLFTFGTLGSFISTWLMGILTGLIGLEFAQYLFPILEVFVALNAYAIKRQRSSKA